jgi:hypothetical protein
MIDCLLSIMLAYAKPQCSMMGEKQKMPRDDLCRLRVFSAQLGSDATPDDFPSRGDTFRFLSNARPWPTIQFISPVP